jgi:hypothetical protein
MKQDASFFDETEPALVYIAKKLRDALKLEEIFNQAGIDYGVEADHYRGGVIFRTVRAGAFFYVRPESVDSARDIMRQHGYRPFEGENPAVS